MSTNRSPGRYWRTITLLLLAANLVFGIAIIALLPPFEGIDETSHFARIQSQAFVDQAKVGLTASGARDKLAAHISTEVDDYTHRGPMPYQWIDFDLLHQDDPQPTYATYAAFFLTPERISHYRQFYDHTIMPDGFVPAPEINAEYQHPALYYMLLSVPMKVIAGHASLLTTLFILRTISFLLAFVGFAIGLYATRSYLRTKTIADAEMVTALGAFYPFLMPMYFWEFARLGNDSLCLFLFGITWALMLWHMRAPRGEAWIVLGLVMGLSLMVKSFMAVTVVAILAFLALYQFSVVRKQKEAGPAWWSAPLKTACFTGVIAAPIYLIGYLQRKSLGPGHLSQALASHDAWSQLLQHFSLNGFFLNFVGIFHTAIWLFGTWSLLVIDLPIYKPLLLSALLVVAFYLIAARAQTDKFFYALPLWIIATFIAGLSSNIIVAAILDNRDATPGYYLHIFAPAFALIYGLALWRAAQHQWSTIAAIVLCAPIAVLNFAIMISYMTAFAGCAVPTHHKVGYYIYPADILLCTTKLTSVTAQLAVLAWPRLAMASAALALIIMMSAVGVGVRAIRNRRAAFDPR